MAKKSEKTIKENVIIENTFTKEQIINSKRYSEYKDILIAILDNKEYTLREIDDKIEKFMKGKVN